LGVSLKTILAAKPESKNVGRSEIFTAETFFGDLHKNQTLPRGPGIGKLLIMEIVPRGSSIRTHVRTYILTAASFVCR
jgi:hypothetical protein